MLQAKYHVRTWGQNTSVVVVRAFRLVEMGRTQTLTQPRVQRRRMRPNFTRSSPACSPFLRRQKTRRRPTLFNLTWSGCGPLKSAAWY
jgi:hypothetical protein